MMTKKHKTESTSKHKSLVTVLVGLACLLLGMAIAHFIWHFAVLGLAESDVNAALLTGTKIIGVFDYAERYEDSYMAHVTTEKFGEVTIKIPIDTARNLIKGTQVQVRNTLSLVEIKEAGDVDA